MTGREENDRRNYFIINLHESMGSQPGPVIIKGVCALRGKFGPLWSQKLKVAFYHFHPIGLLEGSKCKILAFILLFPLLL